MNAYEHLKNHFMTELDNSVKGLPKEYFAEIGRALDKAAYAYEISLKETALVARDDPVPWLVRTYLVVKKTEGLSDGTLDNYSRILKHFFLFIRKQPEDVVANDIRMFVYAYQQRKTVSDRTLDKYRETICWFFHWAHTEEYIPKNPARSVKSIKYEAKERQALTQVELEYLRLACKTVREKAIVEFLYSTGCRVSELTNVTKKDIGWESGTVHLFGKGKKHRTSYINAKCSVALSEYLKTRSDESEYLFVSDRNPHGKLTKCAIERVIKILASRTSIEKKVTPHVFRHTTATQAVNSGMAIEEISRLLGHSNLSTTMVYTKVSNESIRAQHMKHVV